MSKICDICCAELLTKNEIKTGLCDDCKEAFGLTDEDLITDEEVDFDGEQDYTL